MSLTDIGYYSDRNDVLYVDLNRLLTRSFNAYNLYITENELKLSRKDKNKLGIHFIINEIISVCSASRVKKCFFYTESKCIESTLVKKIAAALPIRIIRDTISFSEFISDFEYRTHDEFDISKIDFAKFRRFLKRYDLQQIESKFLTDINIKFSLLP